MAGNSVIGALRVDLGLNSAQFTAGLKNAQGALGKFGTVAARGFTALAAAATVAAGAMGVAVKGAIDHADALSKASQKAGVAVEALSRLEFAAKLSDVSLETLTGGLQKLSKSMADVAAGGGPQTAFAALGIAVKDAAGNLRDSDVVFAEVADRFSRIEDGATKTALSMAIFGKSGAELIPLLNEGRDGLKAMADESDRLGATISTNAAKNAERFNDTLTRVGVIIQGVANKIMEAALPALQDFANTLASPEFQQAAQQLATWIIQAMNSITQVVAGAVNAIRDFQNLFGGGTEVARYTDADRNNAMTSLGSQLGSHASNPWRRTQDASQFYTGFGFTGGKMNVASPANENSDGTGIDLDTFTSGVKKAQEALDPFQARFEELRDVLTPTIGAFEQMQLDLTDLETMWQHGRISVEQYGEAVRKVQLNSVSNIASMAGEITGILGQMFEDNKAIAVANAVVNGIEGVSKALSAYPPPFSFIMAGLQGAAAAVQVGNILSTSKASKSMPGTSTSPSGGAVPNASAGQSINLTVKGSGMINVDDFANQLTKGIADGGHQNLIKVIRAA